MMILISIQLEMIEAVGGFSVIFFFNNFKMKFLYIISHQLFVVSKYENILTK
jgi:hypothetical protein